MLAVLYLIFNEGYGGRGELATEAIGLGRALAELMPDEPEVHALLALMLIHDARREARFRDGSSSCSLTRTARCGIARSSSAGRLALQRSRRSVLAGPTRCRRRSPPCTPSSEPDWPQIAALYAQLAQLTGSPVVELNRAVAIAEAGQVGMRSPSLDALELDRYHYLHATRAELLRRLGRPRRLEAAYRRALELVHSAPEREFLAGPTGGAQELPIRIPERRVGGPGPDGVAQRGGSRESCGAGSGSVSPALTARTLEGVLAGL